MRQACLGGVSLSEIVHSSIDMSLSKDLTQQFKEKQESLPDPEDITFTVMVLGTNFWPLTSPTHSFNIPEDLSKTYERFQRYYQQKHSYVGSPVLYIIRPNSLIQGSEADMALELLQK